MNKLLQYYNELALRFDQLISSFLTLAPRLERSQVFFLILIGSIIRLGVRIKVYEERKDYRWPAAQTISIKVGGY